MALAAQLTEEVWPEQQTYALLGRIAERPLTVLATRLTLIHKEGRIGRCPRVLMDEH